VIDQLPIFPCNAAKVPIAARGYKDARRGPKARGWPLVGFATGAVSGIDVLDVDPDGRAWFDANYDALPQTRAHQTQRGLHLLFRHADGLRCSTSRIAPGVDVKADGGYAIYWPREGLPIEDWPMCEWPEWLLREAMGARTKRNPDTSLPHPWHSAAVVEDFTVALRKLDPIAWRNNNGSEEGYLGWLALMSACKAAGIAVEDFVEWSTQDPHYANDGEVIARKWESVEPKHDGVLRAALKKAGINIKAKEGKESVGVPLVAKPTPTRNLVHRTSALLDWLDREPTEQRLFNVACVFDEIVAERKMKVDVAMKLLKSACGGNGLRKLLGEDGVRRTIANGLRHVEEKLLAVLETTE
jgi:hypothetical protein